MIAKKNNQLWMSSKLDTMKVSKNIMKATFKNTLILSFAMCFIGMVFSITDVVLVIIEVGFNTMNQEQIERFTSSYLLFVSFGIIGIIAQFSIININNKQIEVKR
tara:strand:- start:6519 stop:6833 length:315 start_codon:yes stop_codon:yes gene_type:complete